MTQKKRMLNEKLYLADDKKLVKERKNARKIINKFNKLSIEEENKKNKLLEKLFNFKGDNVYIEPSFKCDYGYNISVGDNFFANFDCVILDVCQVNIGNFVFLGPGVHIYTASHPIDSKIRNTYLEYGKKVKINDNVWIGGNTTINPGVKIGENVVIGSGSVVTKDIPSNVIAAGNPCKVIRKITNDDKKYWKELKQEYINEMGNI
ncbi:MAG: sugar O-acetyltransferase [Bacillota bacterium]